MLNYLIYKVREYTRNLDRRDYIYIGIILILLTWRTDIHVSMVNPFMKTKVELGSFPVPVEAAELSIFGESMIPDLIPPFLPKEMNMAVKAASKDFVEVVPPVIKKKTIAWEPKPYKYDPHNKAAFFDYWQNTVVEECKTFKPSNGVIVLPSIKLAILALETGYGRSNSDPYNMFNIKYRSASQSKNYIPRNVYQSAVAGVAVNERVTNESNKFFKFKTPWLGSRYHSYFILQSRYMRYYNSGAAKKLSPHGRWAYALQHGQYGGADPNYGNKLLRIINDWNLTKYDK